MTRLLLPLLLLLLPLLAPPATVDLELADATLAEAVDALAARGVHAVCVEEADRRATLRFAGLPAERAVAQVATAFGVPAREAGGVFALGGGEAGAVFLLLEGRGTREMALLRAGQTLEIRLGGEPVRAVPLLFGKGAAR